MPHVTTVVLPKDLLKRVLAVDTDLVSVGIWEQRDVNGRHFLGPHIATVYWVQVWPNVRAAED